MDLIDKNILSMLQKDATLPLSAIAKKVGLSTTPCFNRIKKLEEDGVIKKKVAILDNKKINLPVVIFLSIRVGSYSKDRLDNFLNIITSLKEVVEMYRLTGENDYLIKVMAKSIGEYDTFNQNLIKKIDFISLKSNIVLKEIKNTTILPLDDLEQ
ncbi:MAG: Leucine-responsive regulatory protein [Alphaproteobacteria bacterium MarineAlpha5_Bin11]|nr:ArsR family transcriptional regulator [Pelagibacteraceae bacterium]PPR44374.1 MAG: Leucine-responsive regulatory protein [Alphaproteobacteria bacterium MarineAlpha5_Bin11]PPR51493.1 MAG: Leucine-responsive regulatory protein [Alphaproteobacteria bacterium MarineAlpha5_Bin10]|tara:strand:- start:201 stop:665 length:465 start_codon:yes stop_codon:yes gene_type:complete